MRNMNNISELVKYAFVTLLGTLCLAGCGQDEKIGLNATDSVAPGLPTNIEVENINGGAIIRYTPPKDDDLLCVVAYEFCIFNLYLLLFYGMSSSPPI